MATLPGTPKTWSAATLASSDMNAELRDSLEYLWLNTPSARVYNSGNISCTLSTANKLTFDSERHDNAALHNTGSNTSRLTVPADGAGVYNIGANIEWSTTPATYEFYFLLNNTDIIGYGSGTLKRMTIQTTIYLAAADYVEVVVNPATTQTVLATAKYSPEFWMTRISGGV